jgi:hypothetical protein
LRERRHSIVILHTRISFATQLKSLRS